MNQNLILNQNGSVDFVQGALPLDLNHSLVVNLFSSGFAYGMGFGTSFFFSTFAVYFLLKSLWGYIDFKINPQLWYE